MQYTLPRMPHPMRKSDPSTSNPGSAPALNITLKSLRNPPLSLSLPSQSPATSIFELKSAVAKHIGVEGGRVDNIRVLYKKKPCSDSKTVKEVMGDEVTRGQVEFTVMIIGSGAAGALQGHEGARAEMESGGPAPLVAQGPTGDAVLATDEFWLDLRGYLIQRLRDEGKAEEVWRLFKEIWSQRTQKG